MGKTRAAEPTPKAGKEAAKEAAAAERGPTEGGELEGGDGGSGNGKETAEVEVEVEAPGEEAAPPPAPTPEEQLAALNDQYLRLAADFENFRKRSRREAEDLRKYGVETAVRALLPVVDNLERALGHAKGDDPVIQGVRMVAKQFQDTIATFGVQSYDTVGKAFNPELHEAMGQQPAGDAEAGTVLEELEKGYKIHDRLLRPAKVIVAAAHEDTGAGPDASES